MTKLNIGCGNNKMEGAVNVDSEASCNPDLCFDLKGEWPLASALFDEVYFFHTIEHIQKCFHISIFREINRVMKEGGKLFLSYPEFAQIAKCWLENTHGKRAFWENTIYGLQRYPSDYHVSAMDSDEVKRTLEECGFYDIICKPERFEFYNTVVIATRTVPQKTYEELLYKDVFENA